MPYVRRLLSLLALLAAVALGWSIWAGRIALPPRWNPWAPLDIAEAPGLFTRIKLKRLADAPPAVCYAWLDAAGVRHIPIADRAETEDCGWQHATRLAGFGDVRLSTPTPPSCPVVAALALWERHALQPAAFVQLGSKVTGIDHLGSYACRNVYGGSADRRSEHARANALDIAAFRLADGRRVTVLKAWQQADAAPQSAQAVFLRESQKGACPFFSAVLGPAYNTAHRDHFHLDRGPYTVCS